MQPLRQRFLFAMGLGEFLVACTKEKPADTTTNETIALPPATATASATETATATASTAPPPTATTPLGPPGGGGGCGTVIVCDPAPATAPKIAAAKPFERCPATTPQAMNGSDPHREGPFDEEVTKDRRVKSPNVCCYKTPRALCGGGRPLRAEGDELVVARPIAREDWLAELPATVHDASLAARFLVDAAAEHASVASFARVSLQLLALGAPPALIEAVHRAALDEIEHARLCYALAERRGAPRVGPGPLAVDRAPFATSMASFVRDTFLDGCVAETLAAIDLRTREGDEVERSAFERMADDEERHAELAWRMLAWAIRSDPSARTELRRAIGEVSADDPVIQSIVLPCSEALLAG
jgi:hypothetical protein